MLYWLKHFHLFVVPSSNNFIFVIDDNTKPFFDTIRVICDGIKFLVQIPLENIFKIFDFIY